MKREKISEITQNFNDMYLILFQENSFEKNRIIDTFEID